MGFVSFLVQFETSLLRKGERQQVLSFKGQTIFRGNEKILVVGLISTVNRRSTDKALLLQKIKAGTDISYMIVKNMVD